MMAFHFSFKTSLFDTITNFIVLRFSDTFLGFLNLSFFGYSVIVSGILSFFLHFLSCTSTVIFYLLHFLLILDDLHEKYNVQSRVNIYEFAL